MNGAPSTNLEVALERLFECAGSAAADTLEQKRSSTCDVGRAGVCRFQQIMLKLLPPLLEETLRMNGAPASLD